MSGTARSRTTTFGMAEISLTTSTTYCLESIIAVEL